MRDACSMQATMQATVRHPRSTMIHPCHSCHHSTRSFGVDDHLSQNERAEDERGRQRSCRALQRCDRQHGIEGVGQSHSR